MARIAQPSVDDYIAAQPVAARTMLQQVRATLRKALPGATESISYQIPTYKLDGAMVLYFAGFERHYSIDPVTPHVVDTLKNELADRLHGKATIRFALTDKIPTRLITRIAKLRAEEAKQLALTRKVRTAKAAKASRSKAGPRQTSARAPR
jgi:uncharacterized protein YdhG (YjbR/CyaY superfamily)